MLEILKNEGKQIVDEFNLASGQGDGTPQEIADFRENAVQSFVARFYPQSHIVSKGKITDLDGNQSDSIDCLILNPAHPHLIDSKGKFRLIFSDGCDSAIEVKPNLARTDELTRALEQCITVKKTKRSKTPILLARGKPTHIIEHSLHIPFFIFSVKAFESHKLYSEITSYYAANRTPIEQQVDGVCVVGVGILKNVKHKELNIYGADFPVGQNTGWYFEKWGESTPLGFLLNLENTFPSFPGIAESIMKRALTMLGKREVERLGDRV
ncbi:MAG: hypothetical protein Q8N12_03900 [Thermodesulfovibrionales bacterium]|nr:hypothetical protein [Thermodesulfovibrionales bacterium]